MLAGYTSICELVQSTCQLLNVVLRIFLFLQQLGNDSLGCLVLVERMRELLLSLLETLPQFECIDGQHIELLLNLCKIRNRRFILP